MEINNFQQINISAKRFFFHGFFLTKRIPKEPRFYIFKIYIFFFCASICCVLFMWSWKRTFAEMLDCFMPFICSFYILPLSFLPAFLTLSIFLSVSFYLLNLPTWIIIYSSAQCWKVKKGYEWGAGYNRYCGVGRHKKHDTHRPETNCWVLLPR